MEPGAGRIQSIALSPGINNPMNTIRQHCFTLLNGFNWQPLMDYAFHNQVMQEELERLRKQFGSELFG